MVGLVCAKTELMIKLKLVGEEAWAFLSAHKCVCPCACPCLEDKFLSESFLRLKHFAFECFLCPVRKQNCVYSVKVLASSIRIKRKNTVLKKTENAPQTLYNFIPLKSQRLLLLEKGEKKFTFVKIYYLPELPRSARPLLG